MGTLLGNRFDAVALFAPAADSGLDRRGTERQNLD